MTGAFVFVPDTAVAPNAAIPLAFREREVKAVENVPPPGAGSPFRTKRVIVPLVERKTPRPPGKLLANTTCPPSFRAGKRKLRRLPPPGAGSPLAAAVEMAPPDGG